MRSCIMIAATIIALTATCAYSVPVSSDNYNHQENVEKTATVEEELEKGREACNKDFIEIKANPSILTMQKIYHDYKPEIVSQKYAKLFKNYIRFCKEVFGSTEPAPEEKHLQSIKDSLKMISL